MRNHLLSIAGAAVASVLPLMSGIAAEDSASTELNTAMTDQDYLLTAAASDEYERQAGAIAEQRGQHEEVRSLGTQLIKDHTESTQMITAAATAAGLTPPSPVLHPGLQRKLQELQAVPAEQFDQVFLQQQAEAHVDARQLQRTCIEACDAEPLRNVAGEVVPVIQMHLSHTLRLQRDLEPSST